MGIQSPQRQASQSDNHCHCIEWKQGVLKSIFIGLKYDCLLGIIFTADVRDEMPMALLWLSGYEAENLCTEHDQR